MRPFWVAIPAFLALAACGDDSARSENATADQVLADDRLSGNDLTAIDAVSGSDANMAADVDFNAVTNNDSEGAGNRASPASPSTPNARPKPRPQMVEDQPQVAEEPAPGPVEANSN